MRQLYRLESPGFGQFREGWYPHGLRHHRGIFYVARAQQQALDYPELPFVMLEHPVAVATDAEVAHKVELIYAELVEHLAPHLPPRLADPTQT